MDMELNKMIFIFILLLKLFCCQAEKNGVTYEKSCQ